jgi:drug/metabolite transporter (DMT)-like permease
MLLVLIWGVNFAVVKWALEDFEPLVFNALRFAVASLMVALVVQLRGGIGLPPRAELKRIVALGIIGNVIYQVAFIQGLDLTRAGNASVMLALVPVIAAILAFLSGQERPTPLVWAGVAVSVAGVALVSGAALRVDRTTAVLVGDLIMIGAAVAWAVYTVGAGESIRRHGPVRVTAWTLWIGTIGLVLIAIPGMATQPWGAVRPGAWAGMLFSAIFSIGLAYILWYRGVERIGSTRTAVYVNVAPIVALITGALWLGERLTVMSFVGAACVIGGVLAVRLAGRG